VIVSFDWTTFVLQTVNFVILVWLLQHFLYKPVLSVVDARRADIERHYAEARQAEERSSQLQVSLQSRLDAIAAERVATLKSANEQIEQARQQAKQQTERDNAQLAEKTRSELARERAEAMDAARRAALDLGVGMAVRLLSEVPAPLRAQSDREAIGKLLAGLPQPDRDALLRGVTADEPLQVTTAAPLSKEGQRQWQDQLHQSLGEVPVKFMVEAALLAGAELQFPHAVLRASWRQALDRLRAEANGDAA
jgi:F-type H+-transporting ATPase subunit b